MVRFFSQKFRFLFLLVKNEKGGGERGEEEVVVVLMITHWLVVLLPANVTAALRQGRCFSVRFKPHHSQLFSHPDILSILIPAGI